MAELPMCASEAATYPGVERREARRFHLSLPLRVRLPGEPGPAERPATTRDISFRGIYFVVDAPVGADPAIEFVLTLPSELGGTDPQAKAPEKLSVGAGGQRIRGSGRILRVDSLDGRAGVAVRIERYEFLSGAE